MPPSGAEVGTMLSTKDVMIRAIERRANCRVGELAGQLARVVSEEREAVFDEMQFQRWLGEVCRNCFSI